MQKRPIAIGVAIVALFVTILWFVLWRPVEQPAPEPGEREPPPALPVEEVVEPEEESLPELAASDGLARELAMGLGLGDAFAAAWSAGEVLPRFVRVVDAVATGESPARELAFLAPATLFEAVERDGRWFVDPRGYTRYDFVAAGIAGLDADAAVMAFERLESLLDQAYSDMVGETRPFRPVLERALAVLVDTPEPEGTPELTEAVDRFVYSDPDLEALSLPQKHLLRMGPENQARIEARLREIAARLRAG